MTEDPSLAPPAPAPAVERHPFWGFMDVFLFAGLAIPSMVIGILLVKGIFWVLRIHTKVQATELLPAQFIGYALMFGVLYLIFRVQYGRPFWESLGWRSMQRRPGQIAFLGVLLAFGIGLAGVLMGVQDNKGPMKELLSDPTSMVLLAIFGTTLGPVCEELLFRGFLQPLLVRHLGVAAGIVATAVPFGLLHLQEYGFSWRHVLLITLAGTGFGWMRHATNSTRASTLMHAAYNGLFFLLALMAQRKMVPQAW